MATSGGIDIPVGLDFSSGFKDLQLFGREVDDAAAAVSTKLEGSFDGVQSELQKTAAAAKSAMAALVLSGQKGSAEYQQLAQQAAKAEEGIRQMEAATASVQQELGNLGKTKLESLTENLNSALKFDALGGIGEQLSGFDDIGAGARQAMLNLQAQTGATKEEMESLRGVADDLFLRGVGENVEASIKAVGTAKQQLGGILDDAGLEDFTATAAAIGKVYDKDVNEVIGKSRTFLQNFNLQGKEGGDLIALAMRDAGTAMDDVLDSMDEYSQLLKGAGFNAQETVALATTAVSAGVRDVDKVFDAAKEAQIRLNAGDASKALGEIATPITASIQEIVKAGESGEISVKQVLQKSATAIQEAFDAGKISAAMRDQLMVAVAGTPAEDIGGELFTRIMSAPIDTSQVQAAASKAGEDIQNALGPSTIFQKIGLGFDLIKTKVSEFAGPVVSGLGSVMTTVSQVGPGMTLMAQGLSKMGGMKGVLSSLGGSIKGAFSFFTGPHGLVIAAIGLIVVGLIALYNSSEDFREIVDAVVDVLADLGSLLLDVIVGALKLVWDYNVAVAEAIGDLIAGIFGFNDAGAMMSAIMSKISGALDFVKKGLLAFKAGIAGLAVGVKTFVSEASGSLSSLMKLDFSGFVNGIASAFGKARRAAEAEARRAAISLINDEQLKEDAKRWEDAVKKFSGDFASNSESVIKSANSKLGTWLAESLANAKTDQRRDQIRSFQAQLEDMYNSAIERIKPKNDNGPVVTPVVNTQPAETKFKDLTSSLKQMLDEAESRTENAAKIISQISVDGLEDTYRVRIGEIEKASTDALEKLSETIGGINGQLNTLGDGEKLKIDLDFDNDTSDAVEVTRAEAERLRDEYAERVEEAIAAEKSAQLKQLEKEIGQQRLDALIQQRETETGMELTLLKARQALLSEETREGIVALGDLRLAELEKQQARELDAQLRAMPEFTRDLGAAIKALNATTPEQIGAIFDTLRARYIRENDLIGTIVAGQADARFAVIKETESKISELTSKRLAEDRAAFEASTGYRLSLNLNLVAEKLFTSGLSEEERKRTEDKLSELNSRRDLELEHLRDGESTYEQYIERLNEIDRERDDLQRQLAQGQFDTWKEIFDGLRDAMSAALQSAVDQFSKLAQEATTKVSTLLVDFQQLSKEGSGATKEEIVAVWADLEKNATAAYTNIGIATGAAFADMVVKGELTLRSFLQLTLRALKAAVPVMVAQIVGKSFAESPLTGAFVAAGAITVLTGLISLAESAVQGFKTGGLVRGGEKMIRINEIGEEFVHDHRTTAANIEAFDWLNRNKGRRIEDWIIQKYGGIVGRDEPAAQNAAVVDAIDRLGSKVERLEETFSTQFESRQAVEVEMAPVTFDGSHFHTTAQAQRRKSLRLGS